MSIALMQGAQQDQWRDPRGPGAHEWWYFDAHDPRTQTALTIVFFRGIPFSGLRQQNPLLPPDSFPAVAFSFYGPTRTEHYLVNLHEEIRIGSDRMTISIGRNRASWREGAYEILIDDELLDGRSLRASFTFSPIQTTVMPTPRIETESSAHTWIIAAPTCAVEGSIEVDGQPVRRFQGRGYHDHNVGEQALQRQFRHWRWGRAHFTDHTLLFYEADGASLLHHYLVDEQMARNVYLLRYPRTLRVITGLGVYRVEQSRILDNGPFYIRFQSQFTSPSGQKAVGFSEVLRPGALDWRWFHPLLDSRVRPPRSGDRIGRRLTQWLIQRGF